MWQAAGPGAMPPRAAWYLVGVLTAAYIVSFIDRQLLGLLVSPIRAALGIGDFQMGLLLGLAFSIFYTTLGIPIGWLADRVSRRNLVVVGVTLWCVMTAACGLARSYGQLFVLRVGVGVGESTLSPCAYSLIGDAFAPERRGRAISVFLVGTSVGGGLAYLLGGRLVATLSRAPGWVLPGVGTLEPWQMAFLAAGIAGLLITALLLTAAEPPRRRADDGEGALRFRQVLAQMAARRRDYLSLIVAIGLQLCVGSSSAWLVTFFERRWQWTVGEIGAALGALFLVFGPLGSVVGGWLSDRFAVRGMSRAAQRVAVLGMVTFVPAAILFPLMPSAGWALAVLVPYVFGSAASSSAAAAAILELTPAAMRGQGSSLYLLATSAFGFVLGPATTGYLSQHFAATGGLSEALVVVACVYGIPAPIVLGWNALRGQLKPSTGWGV